MFDVVVCRYILYIANVPQIEFTIDTYANERCVAGKMPELKSVWVLDRFNKHLTHLNNLDKSKSGKVTPILRRVLWQRARHVSSFRSLVWSLMTTWQRTCAY